MAQDRETAGLAQVRHRLRRMDAALGRHGIKPGKQQAWEEYLEETLRLLKAEGGNAN